MSTVLVTGGTGFVGAHAIAQLLAAGHDVRTTVRSRKRQGDVERMLAAAGAPHPERVSYFEADLTGDGGWTAAVRGADYVLHIASPFPGVRPRTEDELIIPARDGALRVLRAARDAGVRRVVLTSSCAAVTYGHPRGDRVFTEDDWTDLDGPGVSAYVRSKTVAERAAWDFARTEGGDLEPTVINTSGHSRFDHPIAGPLELRYEKLLQPDSRQLLVVYHAEPCSPSAERLQLLAF
jgi:nucleoside-diphosphate-sugar epimerase